MDLALYQKMRAQIDPYELMEDVDRHRHRKIGAMPVPDEAELRLW